MAGLKIRGTVSGVALAAATVETVMQLIAAANHRVVVGHFEVSFDGVSTTDQPILVEVLVQTTAGTSSALTLAKDNAGDDESIQTTALQLFTAEPTASTILRKVYVHPQGSRIIPGPFIVPGGTRLGIRCTAPNVVNAAVSIVAEE